MADPDSQVNCGNTNPGAATIRCTVVTRRIVDDQGQNEKLARSSFKFTPEGHLRERIDALGQRTIYRYEPGRPYIHQIEVQTAPTPVRVTESLTTFAHDADGQMTRRKVVLASGEAIEETWQYDHGWVSQYRVTRDAENDEDPEEEFRTDYTFYRRDGNGDETIDPNDPEDPVTNVHEIKRLVRLETPADVVETTVLSYNGHGRLESVQLPDGHQIEWGYYDSDDDAYDAVGNVRLVRDPKDQETMYAYDGLSRLKSVTQEEGETVSYEYDLQSRLARVTNARLQVLVYDYEEWGGLASVEHYPNAAAADAGTPLTRTVSYTYDLAGNLASTTDSDQDTGVATDTSDPNVPYLADRLYKFSYDALDRPDVTTVYYLPGGATPGAETVLDASYNRFGERDGLTVTEGAGPPLVHSWQYDLRGRLQTATLPGSAPLSFTSYLGDDSLETLVHPNGLTTSYGYKTHGPLESITVSGSGGDLHELLYTLDATDAIEEITETLNGGTGGTPFSPSYVYEYDGAARLSEVTSYPSGQGLPSTTPEQFPYDLAGNRDDDPGAASPWDYSGNNEIGSSPTPGGGADTSYAFDPDGNLQTRTSPGGVETFTFNQIHRLVAYENAGSGADFSYAYDPFGRRVKKADSVTSDTTLFLWDGDRLLAEYDGASGAREVRYAYAGGFAPAQVAYPDGSGEEIFEVHSDHLDTPRVLTRDTGVPEWRASYEAFGTAHVSDDPDGVPGTPDPGRTFNIRFPGQYYDVETARWDPVASAIVVGSGLHDNMHRYYSPELGRYISADPIGQRGGINLYTYTGNNPINRIDPTGEAFIINLSNRPVRSSQNREGGGQDVFEVPPGGTSGFRDADTLIADDGSVIKVPDPLIVIVTDDESQESFDQDSVDDITPPLPIPDPRFNPRLIPDPEAEFGPFFNPDGTPFEFPDPCE